MAATTPLGTTFAVDAVPVGTDPLPPVRLKAAVEKLLGTPVEACDSYTAAVADQPGFHALIAAADLAYRGHFPLVLTPDVIWLTIAQGFARHVTNHAERLRPLLVRHPGKLPLAVLRDDFVRGSPENPWAEVWPAFAGQIRDHLGAEAHALVVCDFSTTGPTERAASEIVLMDAVQAYFEYHFVTLCGIPAVTLEGTVADWATVRERAGRLARYDLAWWTDRLRPILEEFVLAAAGTPTPAFWQRLYKEHRGSGGPYVTGWLVELLPYLKHREFLTREAGDPGPGEVTPWRTDLPNFLFRPAGDGRRPRGLTHQQLPASVSAVPFTWHDRGGRFAYQFLAGVTAVTQDPETRAVRPRIGWAVRPAPAAEPPAA
jgi:hypothetical protein